MPPATLPDIAERAAHIARARGNEVVSSAHLMLALLECEGASRANALLTLCNVRRDEVWLYVEAMLDTTQSGASENLGFTVGAQRAQRDALLTARYWNDWESETAYLLIALAEDPSELGAILSSLGLKPQVLRGHLHKLQKGASPHGNPLKMLDAPAKVALDGAQRAMRATYCGRIGTAHLLLGILENRHNETLLFLAEHGVDLDALAQITRAAIRSDGEIGGPIYRLSPAAREVFERAKERKRAQNSRFIGVPELLWALLPRPGQKSAGDPLDYVWSQIEVEPLQRAVNELVGEMPRQQRFDWRWALVGISWALLLLVDEGGAIFLFGIAGALTIVLASAPESRWRMGALNFVGAAILVSLVLVFVLTSLV